MLPLEKLTMFVTVARLENVSRAARVLHISQSPLSRQLRAFEDAVGVELFTRERKRLRLTPAGRALLVEATGLLEASAGVERRVRAVASGARHVTIGYVAGAVYAGALTRDLERLRRRSPTTTVELRTMRSMDQARALELGAIDVAYTYAPTPAGAGTLVAQEAFMVAAPREPRGAPARRLLTSMPLVTLPESTSARAQAELLAACARIGVVPKIGIEATDPAVVLALVGAGLGVALVQAGLRAYAPRSVRFLRLPAAFGLDVKIYRLARNDELV